MTNSLKDGKSVRRRAARAGIMRADGWETRYRRRKEGRFVAEVFLRQRLTFKLGIRSYLRFEFELEMAETIGVEKRELACGCGKYSYGRQKVSRY